MHSESHHQFHHKPDSKRVLLIGGSGLLGPFLQHRLVKDGYEVFVTSRTPGDHIDPHAKFIKADFEDPKAMDESFWADIIKTNGIEVVINNAALTSSSKPNGHEKTQQFNRINYEVPTVIFQAAQCAGIEQVIQVSSLSVTAPEEKVRNSHYPRTKQIAEEKLKGMMGNDIGESGKTQFTIVRPAAIVSKEPGGFPVRELATAYDNLVPVVGNKKIDPIRAKDAARVIVKCVGNKKAFGETIPAVGPTTTWGEILRAVRVELGLERGRTVRLPGSVATTAIRTFNALPLPVQGWISRFLPEGVDLSRGLELFAISTLWRLPVTLADRKKMTEITGVHPKSIEHEFREKTMVLNTSDTPEEKPDTDHQWRGKMSDGREEGLKREAEERQSEGR